MTKLEQLINELCPDGVEYRDVSSFAKNESAKNKGQKNTRAFSITQRGLIPTSEYFKDARITSEDTSGYKIVKHHWFVYSPSRIDVGSINYLKEEESVIVSPLNVVFSIDEKIITAEYLLYFLQSRKGTWQILTTRQGIEGTGRKLLPFEKFGKIKVPVPPLPVQEEIVRILDSFTQLTAELTAELTARKKQYEYYRDSLLTFGDDVPMVKLADIATSIYRGAGIKRDEVTPGGIPCVRYGEIYTSYDISFTECISHTRADVVASPKFFEHGDIIFTITGESVEEIAKSIAYLGYDKCMAGGDTVVMKHNQEPRYISYVLSTAAAQTQKSKGKVKSKVVHSSVPALKDIEIPLPDMDTQKRIADLLDNFHSLCNDITTGLPAEIEARKKQYEYYRDKLLTFKELGT